MRAADIWIEAAELAEMWAAVGRAGARKLDDAWKADVTEHGIGYIEKLARAFRQLATTETREIDFDDRPTPVALAGTSSAVLLEGDETDPDAK